MSVVSTPSMKVIEWAVLFENKNLPFSASQELPDFCERNTFQKICFKIKAFVYYLFGDKTYDLRSNLNSFIRVATSISKEDIQRYVNTPDKRKIGFAFSAVEKLIEHVKECGRESGGQPIISTLHVLKKEIKKTCVEIASEEVVGRITGLKIEENKIFYQVLDGTYIEERDLLKEYGIENEKLLCKVVSDVHKRLLPVVQKWLVEECNGWKETSSDSFLKYCNEKWILAEHLFLAHVGKEAHFQLKTFLDGAVKKKSYDILSQEISEKKGFLRFDQLTKRVEELCKESVSSEELEKKIVASERLLEEMDGLYFFYRESIGLLQEAAVLPQEVLERIRKQVTEKYTTQIDVLRLNKQRFTEVAFSRRHFKQLSTTVQNVAKDLYSVDQIDKKKSVYLWNYFNQIEKEIQKIALEIPQLEEWKESVVLIEHIRKDCRLAKEYINLRIGEEQASSRVVIDGLTIEAGGTCVVHSEIETIIIEYVKAAEEEFQSYQKKNKKAIESILGKTCLGFIGGGMYGYAQAGIPGMCTEAIIAATAVLASSVTTDVGDQLGLPKWGSEVVEMIVFASSMYGLHRQLPLYLKKSDSELPLFGGRVGKAGAVMQKNILNSIRENPPLCPIDQAPVLAPVTGQKISVPVVSEEKSFWEGFWRFFDEYTGIPMYGASAQPSGSSYDFIGEGGVGASPLGYGNPSSTATTSNMVFVGDPTSPPVVGEVVYVYSSVGGARGAIY